MRAAKPFGGLRCVFQPVGTRSPSRFRRAMAIKKLSEEVKLLEQNRGNFGKVFPGYITHIRFPRFKNMADGVRIEFSFPVTALVGVNGSGKTSVLNALYGAPARKSTGQYWFSTKVDPIEE